jgi:hypothetical protein
MPAGKITVSNFSENVLDINIVPNKNPGDVPVASGTLNISQTSGFAVSGYDLYQVNFYPSGQNAAISARGIVPDAIVEISITNEDDEDTKE